MEELWTRFVILHLASLVIFLVSHTFSSRICFTGWSYRQFVNLLKCALFAGTACRTSRVSGLSFKRHLFQSAAEMFSIKMSSVPYPGVWFMWITFQGGDNEDGCDLLEVRPVFVRRVLAGWSGFCQKGAGLLLKSLKQPPRGSASESLWLFLLHRPPLLISDSCFTSKHVYFPRLCFIHWADWFLYILTNFNERGLPL